MKITQGKWTADDMGCYVFAHDEQMMVCMMRGWAYLKGQGLSDEEAIEVQKANARLIAAAPEMYELLMDYPADPAEQIAWLIRRHSLLARIDGKETAG